MVKAQERGTSKKCVRCDEVKPETDFELSGKYRRNKCKRCRQNEANERYARNPEKKRNSVCAWREKNPERKVEIDAKSYQKRREQILAQKKKYHRDNAEEICEKKRKYRQSPEVREYYRQYNRDYHPEYYSNNKHRYIERFVARRELKRKAMPEWADRKAIAVIYKEARRLTKATGMQHEVDHIIPLQGKTVCGLHVESNLQILTAEENRTKSNNFDEDIVRYPDESLGVEIKNST